MKFLFLFFWFGLLANILFAQKITVIDTKQNYFPLLNEQVLALEDAEHKLSFEQISQLSNQKFYVPNRYYTNFGITSSIYWVKFKVLNTTSEKSYLRIVNPLLDTAELYVLAKNELVIQKTVLARKPEMNVPNSPFLLPSSTDTLTCYLRVSSRVPLIVQMYILPESHVTSFVLWQSAFDMLFFGGILIMILYNLFLGITTRNISYFYYVSYSFFLVITTFFIKGYPVPLLGEYAFVIDDYFAIYVSLASIFLAIFTQNFLQLSSQYQTGKRLLDIAIGLQMLVIIIFLMGFVNLNVLLYQIVNIFGNICVLWSAFYLYKKKDYKPALLFLIAFFSYLVLLNAVNLTFANLLPSTMFTLYFFHIGSSIELVLFSIALGDKINLYRKETLKVQAENLTLVQEQNIILENKVKERTEKLQEMNEEMNTQNEELNQVNEELSVTLELVEKEKSKSDALLLNILPVETAQELKEFGHATPQHYKLASVLFTDFKGFTNIAEKLEPYQVIEELNTCFLAFDEICEKYNMEKIKTIGDAYMCAGGIPVANTTSPQDAVNTALEIQEWMEKWKQEKIAQGKPVWEVRIGIHSGEVIAGVVGKNKFAYDIWGDTVNLASRMESSGEVGKVNISGETYQLIKDDFDCTFRGKIQAKNKGEVEMYFVNHKK